MNQVWIRLNTAKDSDRGFSWALWQPKYVAAPWPDDALKPDFTYYVCETLKPGGRVITAKATVKDALPPTEVASPEDAYRMVAAQLFDGTFSIARDAWHANPYNIAKASSPWPQLVTAWYSVTNPVGPHLLKGLERFPRTGWLTTDQITI